MKPDPPVTRTVPCPLIVAPSRILACRTGPYYGHPTTGPSTGGRTMIRCVRIWTGDDQNSHAEEGFIDLAPGARGDFLSGKLGTSHASFQETRSGGTFQWHTAPVRQLVITLSGKLDFQTRGGQHFILEPGEILLAEDTTGGGHSWKLVNDEPWRRLYVVLEPGTAVPFKRAGQD